MPPFPLHFTTASSKQAASELNKRNSIPSAEDPSEGFNMDWALLKPRSLDTFSAALLPLEPLSSLPETGAAIHYSNDLNPRDTLSNIKSRDISDATTHQLSSRALTTNIIPLSYNLSGAKAATVVGATLGAVAGTILLVWVIWILTSGQGTGAIEGEEITAEEVHVRRHHHSDRSRRSRRTRTHRSEMSERSPPPRRRERILVEETRRRERSSVPPPPEPVLSPERETHTHVEVETERRVDGDDVVEVIEEQSVSTAEPPRRKKSGYRTVDPSQYGGGNYEQRQVYESDRRRSKRSGR